MRTLPVIKIEMVGTVTSFRYPHFTQGFQPSFEMPPPSTIYGHICSAVGNYVSPESLRFGYHFVHAGKFVDYREHLHFNDPIQPFPFDRELLFEPRLTLYVTRLDLFEAFRHPHYAVALGRSQDLMTYRSIKIIELQEATEGYFEATLLPLRMAASLDKGTIAVTMARYIDPRRRPQWTTYTLLKDAALWPPPAPERHAWDSDDDHDIGLVFEQHEVQLWIDPETPDYRLKQGVKRAVWLHSFVEE